MDYLTGVQPKETLEISELLSQAESGATVKVNGAVHTIRDMGTVAFVILRKREGLLQCVYEEGTADFDLKDLKEAATVEVVGILEQNEKAPNGIEEIKYFSGPKTELSFHLPEKCKRTCKIPDSGRTYQSISGFPVQPGIYRNPYSKDRGKRSGRWSKYF